ncbi:prophage tail gpP-like protein [Paucimonas lemoignei]|uniref:Prophage tail gpP-like protein n=1 Tax=Paucimonas lemoignei TaxID=29443 RepID=A0A4R3I1J6_PAULE|nr:phage tail protein [Paucimonas lemoignei]TCS38475.1 prophage tail gpP-like protein [Paucimonas lemoignei]
MSDVVRVLVGGTYHDQWDSYRLDSDLLTPADDWHVTASYRNEDGKPETMPSFIQEGAPIKIMLDNDLILDGRIDDIDEDVSKENRTLELWGRDHASLLVDCSAPLLTMQQATLDQIIKRAVAMVGIKTVRYDAKPAAPRQKVQTEPGQNIWEWLQSACEANLVWPWFTPDGVLVIGQPDYTTAPVANVILRFDGAGNNALGIRRRRSLRKSYSEVTILGQASAEGEVGNHNIKGVATDATVPVYRPRVVIDGNCENAQLANHRAQKLIADGRMSRDTLTIEVEGHRIREGNGAGKPWAPGMRINVQSEPHGIDNAVYFVIGRTFIRSRSRVANYTELRVIPDGTWLLDIPFVKAKRRSSYGTRKGQYTGEYDAAE